MRLHDAFQTFLLHLEHERQCSPRTIVAYRGDSLQFLAWLDRTVTLETVRGGPRPRGARPTANDLALFTTAHLRAWQASLALERKLGPAAVRRKLHAMKSFARFAVRTGALTTNPCDGLMLPKPRRRVRTALPLAAFRRVLALPLPPREATLRGLLAFAGLRKSEVLDLTVRGVRLDPVAPTLLIRGKGDRERVVPIPVPLRELLLDYLLRTGKTGPGEYLFTTDAPAGRNRPMHGSRLDRTVKRWGKAVGVHLYCHLFRHTYATALLLAGVPPDTIADWMGHADLSTVMTYLHTAQSPAPRRTLEAWAAAAGYPAAPDPTPDRPVSVEQA